ncbi:hypothetical protein LZ32DRAFT_608896 [Colletotrichum eremochloae]|nr:hypothetical protein LZ32DRAFT_608896 [Colletotrichum eremochloae]
MNPRTGIAATATSTAVAVAVAAIAAAALLCRSFSANQYSGRMSWLGVAGGMWQAKYVYSKHTGGVVVSPDMLDGCHVHMPPPLWSIMAGLSATTHHHHEFCFRVTNYSPTAHCTVWTPAVANMIPICVQPTSRRPCH